MNILGLAAIYITWRQMRNEEVVEYPADDGSGGEAVILERLGSNKNPAIDTLTIMRQYALPDAFSDEVLDDDRFTGIRVVKSNRDYPTLDEIRKVIGKLNTAFERDDCTKEEVIRVLSDHLPTFCHAEKNKYLDQRM